MKFKILVQLNLIMIFTISTPSGFAQAPDVLWTKNYGGNNWDTGNSVLQTNDGGFYITGQKGFIPGQLSSGDVWLIRTDSNGDTLWSKTYGDSSGRDEGYSIKKVTGGGYIIAGQTTSFGAGESDAFVIRINDNGDTLWTRTYGGESQDYVTRIQQTSDNGFIMVGHTYSYGLGSFDVWLIRTDENGDTIWTNTFGTSGVDLGNSIQQTSDGGFIITGRRLSFSSGTPDLYLVRTDSNGDSLWTRGYNGPVTPFSFDEGKGVYQLSSGGYLAAGISDAKLWLLRIDENGDTLWTKLYNEPCSSVDITSDGGFIISGNNSLTRINEDLNILWTKVIGESSDFSNSVQQTSDGGYIVTGKHNSSGNNDVWLVRIDSDGTTSITDNSIEPLNFQLFQNYPNPFNPSTKISWQSPIGSHQTLKVYDALGNEVVTLVNEYKPAGSYEVEWNASHLSSGVYFYQLKAGEFIETKKLTLIK